MKGELENFFRKYEFKEDDNTWYGIFNSRIVSISSRGNYDKIAITVSQQMDQRLSSSIATKIGEKVKGKYPILQRIMVSGIWIELLVYRANDIMNQIEGLLSDAISTIDEYTTGGIETCPACGRVLTTDSPFIKLRGNVCQVHDECYDKLEKANQSLNEVVEKRNEKLKLGKPILITLLGVLGLSLLFFAFSFAQVYPYIVSASGWLYYYLIQFMYIKFKVPMYRKIMVLRLIGMLLTLVLSVFLGSIGYLCSYLNFGLFDCIGQYGALLINNPEISYMILLSLGIGIFIIAVIILLLRVSVSKRQTNTIKKL